jgi:transcription termination factor NusB
MASKENSNDWEDDKEALVREANLYFEGEVVFSDADTITNLVSIDDRVAEFYLTFKKQLSISKAKPDWLDTTKEDLSAWDDLADARTVTKKKNIEWQEKVNKAALVLKETINSVATEKKKYYKNIRELLVIDSVTIAQLPLVDKTSLFSKPPSSDRDSSIKTAVADYKAKLYNDFKNGNFRNPF